MSTPTLYVAGPMSGLPEFNYPAFNHAADELRDAGYSVLNPADTDPDDYPHAYDGPTPPWQWWMRQALALVIQADGIALLPGWDRSRGARLEVHVGDALDMPHHPVDYWIAYADEIRAEVSA